MGTGTHLHRDDYPGTLAILAALLGSKADTPPGYSPTPEGAWVDWAGLEASWLSSSEIAAVVIARGLALAESAGGLPPAAASVVATRIDVVANPPEPRGGHLVDQIREVLRDAVAGARAVSEEIDEAPSLLDFVYEAIAAQACGPSVSGEADDICMALGRLRDDDSAAV